MARIDMVFFDVGNTLMNFNYGTVARIAGLDETALGLSGPQRWKLINDKLDEAHRTGEKYDAFHTLIHNLVFQESGVEGVRSVMTAADTFSLWNKVNQEARQAVASLKQNGVRVGVISNADGTVADLLNLHGWDGIFEVVIDSGVVGVSKPDPRIFELALTQVGVDSANALYVGDLPSVDVQGSIHAGMGAILYDPHDLYRDDLERITARHGRFHRVTDMRHLPALIELLKG